MLLAADIIAGGCPALGVVGEVGDVVLRDRRTLATDGIFMIVVTVDRQTGRVVGRPEVVTRGYLPLNEADPMLGDLVDKVLASIATPREHLSDVAVLKAQVKEAVTGYLYASTKRRPVVYPVIVEV